MEMVLQTTGQQAIDATNSKALERATDDAQIKSSPPLGDRPLITLAAGQNMNNAMLPT